MDELKPIDKSIKKIKSRRKTRFSKKFIFAILSFTLSFLSFPFVLNLERVKEFPFLYQLVMVLSLLLCLLVVSVSYLTGQAKIDIEANYGPGGDDD